jgi:hypothetical protein
MPRQKPITIEAAQTFGVLLHVKPPPGLQRQAAGRGVKQDISRNPFLATC